MPRPILKFCIPFNEQLEQESGWRTQNQSRTIFVSARAHFAIFRLNDPNPFAHYGEPIDTIIPRKSVKIGSEIATKYNIQVTDTYKTIKGSLIENSILRGMSAEVAAQIGVPNVSTVGSKLSTTFQDTFKTQIAKTFELSRAYTESAEVSLKMTFGFDAETEGKQAQICPTYRKVHYDVHLTHLDYLSVHYERRQFGLRKLRKKVPALRPNGKPDNLVKIMRPLFSIGVWDLNTSLAIKWNDEEHASIDPLETFVDVPKLITTPFVGQPDKPSLYHLSSAAFPMRWIKRKGDEWTEEQLRAAELDEARNSAWWFQYGPGRTIPKSA